MDQGESAEALKAIAAEAFAALGNARQIRPFSSRPQGLSVDNAYRVTPLVRQMYEAGGAKALGRKIGFTNRTIWQQYGVFAPIWGYVFDRTVHDLAGVETLPLALFSEPRIEPEIMFGLAAAPSAPMDETALSSCIAWVALGALLIGPRHPFAPRAAEWQRTLSAFEIDLNCDGRLIDRGHAENVLGGPLSALRHLTSLLASDPPKPPLPAGEIVSTGTLTKAMPIVPGEVWSAAPNGIALDAIQLRFI